MSSLLYLVTFNPLIETFLLVLRYTRHLYVKNLSQSYFHEIYGQRRTSEIVFAFLTTSMKPVFVLVARQPYGMSFKWSPSFSQSYKIKLISKDIC